MEAFATMKPVSAAAMKVSLALIVNKRDSTALNRNSIVEALVKVVVTNLLVYALANTDLLVNIAISRN